LAVAIKHWNDWHGPGPSAVADIGKGAWVSPPGEPTTESKHLVKNQRKICVSRRLQDASLTRVKVTLPRTEMRTLHHRRPANRIRDKFRGHLMHIRNLTVDETGNARVSSATISWEDRDFPDQTLSFTISEDNGAGVDGEPGADAFLAACFPLAAVHGEARVRIEGRPCPMLVEGLRTAHAWWTSWGGMPTPAPEIETAGRDRGRAYAGPRRAVAFISGGVDGLHTLMRNRQLYRRDDPAYFRDALFIHGFDIGKRARDPENDRYQMALRRLEPIAAETGVRLISCRTNLRHLPTRPDFWEHRHNGAALAAVGHAATRGPVLLFVAASHHANNPVPWGSHPLVDGLFSTQRVTIMHDGARFSRLDKVRDLAKWPAALAALRVCSANVGTEANCGRCEKCLRTRLELLAAGVETTPAFGSSMPPPELWDDASPKPIGGRAAVYEELLPALRTRGLDALCRMLAGKIAAFEARERPAFISSAQDGPRLFG
jgi:hypothetical protein